MIKFFPVLWASWNPVIICMLSLYGFWRKTKLLLTTTTTITTLFQKFGKSYEYVGISCLIKF